MRLPIPKPALVALLVVSLGVIIWIAAVRFPITTQQQKPQPQDVVAVDDQPLVNYVLLRQVTIASESGGFVVVVKANPDGTVEGNVAFSQYLEPKIYNNLGLEYMPKDVSKIDLKSGDSLIAFTFIDTNGNKTYDENDKVTYTSQKITLK